MRNEEVVTIWAGQPPVGPKVELRFADWDKDTGNLRCTTRQLVGEGCPWATVQQMADDLGKAQFSYSASITDLAMDRDPPGRADCQARTDRVAAAAALLSSGSNP